ncbi:glycosyltransferase family 2 protein [Thalassotalea aquiviva]|uniref:glycosyltransferase family 2 protein n=1 Tax=Thalassotalea aquiviva TaxID=3242415 RepID=UPI00352A3C12
MRIGLAIPTYNGGSLFRQCLKALSQQSLHIDEKLVVDSSSTDDTRELAKEFGFNVITIRKDEFDHGGTRNFAMSKLDVDIVIFLTQDSVLADCNALSSLIKNFEKQHVSAAYGRQLPHHDANLLAISTRLQNYPNESYVTNLNSDYPKGFKKAFISNSFAAYVKKDVMACGGFPKKLILGEDSYIAAKLLLNNKSVAYCSNSRVHHSHNYTIKQEFKRYFDIGVFHQTQNWMLKELGSIEGEGLKFALIQIKFTLNNKKLNETIRSVFTTIAKFIGYKAGKKHQYLPLIVRKRFAMHKGYFGS